MAIPSSTDTMISAVFKPLLEDFDEPGNFVVSSSVADASVAGAPVAGTTVAASSVAGTFVGASVPGAAVVLFIFSMTT